MGNLEVPSRGTWQNMAKSVTICDMNAGLLDHDVRFRTMDAELHKRSQMDTINRYYQC
jgi:hypothetical protein